MNSVRIRIGALFAALAVVAVLTIPVLRMLEGRRMETLALRAAEHSREATDIARLTGLDRAKYATFISDYTWWDELADFVGKPDRQWATDNIDSSFDAVKADAIWVVDRRLRTVYGAVRPGSRLTVEFPFPRNVLTAKLRNAAFTDFWLQTRVGLAEIRVGRTHRSNDPNRTGPYTGYLVAVHLWTQTDAKQLSLLADADVHLVATGEGTSVRGTPGAFEALLPLKDYQGRQVAALRLRGASREAAILHEAETRERWSLMLFAALLYGLVALALGAWVNGPLRQISNALASQKGAALTRLAARKGEFGEIASNLYAFLEQKHRLEEEIAERKRAEERLQASEDRLRGILDTVQSGIFVVDAETHLVVDANPAMLRIAGAERDEVVGRPCHDCVCPAERGRCPVTDLGMTVDSSERTLTRPDGQVVPILKSVKGFEIGGRNYLIESVTDITDLRRAQEALDESRRRYLEFFAQNPVPCWVYDAETLRFVDVNEVALRHYGYTRSQFLELTVPDIRPGEDAATLRASIASEAGVRHREAVRYRTRGGRDLDVDTTSIPLSVEGRPCRLVVAYDVTDRVAAEARADALRKELERSNRELQDFASVASHDLQEPLRKVSAFADRLVRKYAETLPEEGRTYLDRMLNAVGRMQSLIEDLLVYSRVTTRAKPFVTTNLNEILEEVIGDLEARLAISGGRVEAGRLPRMEADPTQIRQLFQNLIGNALKFRREDVAPVVTLSAEKVDVDGEEWCRLTVADNGIGFDNQYAERIFGVFERLHGREQFEGTGMGLAIVRKLVQRHGGTVTANGVPGEGATFTIMLPMHHPEQPPQDEATAVVSGQ